MCCRNGFYCRRCSGTGTIRDPRRAWWQLFKTTTCPECHGSGEPVHPLAHLTPEERQLVLKRGPDPKDLKRLGISLITVRPPFKKWK